MTPKRIKNQENKSESLSTLPEGELLFSHLCVTTPDAPGQRAPVQGKPGSEQAEVTHFQGDQGWSQGQRVQCLFSIIPLARLTGLHVPSSAEKGSGFRGLSDQ